MGSLLFEMHEETRHRSTREESSPAWWASQSRIVWVAESPFLVIPSVEIDGLTIAAMDGEQGIHPRCLVFADGDVEETSFLPLGIERKEQLNGDGE